METLSCKSKSKGRRTCCRQQRWTVWTESPRHWDEPSSGNCGEKERKLRCEVPVPCGKADSVPRRLWEQVSDEEVGSLPSTPLLSVGVPHSMLKPLGRSVWDSGKHCLLSTSSSLAPWFLGCPLPLFSTLLWHCLGPSNPERQTPAGNGEYGETEALRGHCDP